MLFHLYTFIVFLTQALEIIVRLSNMSLLKGQVVEKAAWVIAEVPPLSALTQGDHTQLWTACLQLPQGWLPGA